MDDHTQAFPRAGSNYHQPCSGLSKRELFAAMAMHASLSNGIAGSHLIPENLARESVEQADALLKALLK